MPLQNAASRRQQVPAELWEGIAREAQEAVAVDELRIDVDFKQNLDAFWDTSHKKRACVRRLNLSLSNRNSETQSDKSLKEIFEWIDRCFADTRKVHINSSYDKSLLKFLAYSRCIC